MVEERYEIRGKIGQGGVGVVYKAYDTQLRREVAIKRVLSDELEGDSETATKNLLKEATALSSVQHPHICTVYDAGLDDDGPFVVMELINGKTLDEMVERGSLTYEDFREVAIQSQEAMIAAQELNLVHRDLKPSNVMVSWLPSGRFQIKLVDFGLAKFSAKPSLQTIDHGDAVFGSIFFMAPEQFERTPLDQRTDMYSLGAMFYYALTGNQPFDGETAPQVMASHLQNSVIPLQQVRPDLPMWLCEWVMWHIQRDMDHRPESAQLALQKFLADESGITQAADQSQQLGSSTSPLLRKLNTGTQAVQPAANITGPLSIQSANGGINPSTAPQPILSPNGLPSPSTSPIAIQPSVINQAQGTQFVDTSVDPNGFENEDKKQVSRSTVIVICSMLTVAIVIVCVLLLQQNNKINHENTYKKLINDIENKEILTVTEKELEILLLGLIKSNKNDKIGGYTALSKASAKDLAFSPTLMIAEFITTPGQNIKDQSMEQMIKAIDYNPNVDTEAHKVLLKYAIKHPDKQHSSNAIRNMADIADDSFLNDLLKIYENSTNAATRQPTTKTLIKLIKRSKAKKYIATTIISKYEQNATDKNNRFIYMRLLGATATPKCLEILYQSLNSDNSKLRILAFKALSSGPTIEPFNPMIDIYSKEEEEPILSKYREAMFDLLESADDLTDANRPKYWLDMFTASPNDRSCRNIISRLSRKTDVWAKKLLSDISKMPKLSAELKKYLKSKL